MTYVYSTSAIINTISSSDVSDTEELEINAPEKVSINLTGKRSDFYNIDFKELAVHLDTKNMKMGKNNIKVTSSNLFLPNQIKLLNYIPSNLVVEVRHKSI